MYLFFLLFFNCLIEINETVICTNDHMEVIIPSAFFLNKVPPVYVSNQQLKSAFLKQRVRKGKWKNMFIYLLKPLQARKSLLLDARRESICRQENFNFYVCIEN